MRKLLVLLLWISIGAGCTKEARDIEPTCVERPYEQGRVCPQIYLPVCGCNGQTYSNACEAEGYGIREFVGGECRR